MALRAVLTTTLIALLAPLGGTLNAAEPQAPAAPPDGTALLKKVAARHNAVKSYLGPISVALSTTREGTTDVDKTDINVAFLRPDNLRASIEQDDRTLTVISSGKALTLHNSRGNKYTPVKLRRDVTVSDIARQRLVLDETHQASLYLAALTGEDIYNTLTMGAEKIELVEPTQIRVHTTQGYLDVYINKDDSAIARISLDIWKAIAAAAERNPALKGMKFVLDITLDPKGLDKPVAAETFVYTPPEGVNKVETVNELLSAKFALVPDLKAPQLGAEEHVAFAGHKGQVLVLDFFTTTCGFCRRTLPELEQQWQHYKQKAVQIVAVDVGETPEVVAPFVKEMGMTMPVALDAEGEVAGWFGVDGFPTTIVVGRDGRVAEVYVGALPDLKEKLAKRIDELLQVPEEK